MSEGRVEWDEGWTWYRVAGDLGAEGPAPLVILHGGPGAAHDYLGTTETGRPAGQRGGVFSADAVRVAERDVVALLSSLQLLHALNEHQHARLDVDAFWETVHSAAGVVDLPSVPAV
jgi:pimeloyl-ACP methyl ester carboxylesterase